MERKTKPYAKLRGVMSEMDMTQEEAAINLKCSTHHISACMCGKAHWTLREAYALLKLLGLPEAEVYTYFPPNGYGISDKKLKLL